MNDGYEDTGIQSYKATNKQTTKSTHNNNFEVKGAKPGEENELGEEAEEAKQPGEEGEPGEEMEQEGPLIKVRPIQAARVESYPRQNTSPSRGSRSKQQQSSRLISEEPTPGAEVQSPIFGGLGAQTRPRSKVQFPGKQRPLGPVTRVPGARGPGVQCPCYPAERPGTDLRGQSPRSDF